MKQNAFTLHKAGTAAVLLAAAFSSAPLNAAQYTWNTTSGSWSTTDANWLTGGSSAAWEPDSTTHDAVFGTGSDVTNAQVSVVGDYSPMTLTVNNSGYTLVADTPSVVTLLGTGTNISVASGKSFAVGNNVTLTNVNLPGNVMIAGGGTLNVDSGGALVSTRGTSSSTISLNDTTLNLNSGGSMVVGEGTFSGLFVNGAFNVNGGSGVVHGTVGIGQTTGVTAGTVNVNSGTLSALGANGVRFGSSTATLGGTLNLNGGALRTAIVQKGSGAVASSVMNFNGGTLVSTTSSASFLGGLERANVRDGGAKINTAGFNVTVSQGLLHSNIGGDSAVDGGLAKNGLGTLTLSGSNSHTGATVVNEGTLVVTGGLHGGGGVSVSNGAEFVHSGAVNASSWNIAGRLSGSAYTGGGLGSAVTVTSTGTIAPGTLEGGLGAFAMLSLTGTTGAKLTLDIGKLTPGSDPAALTDYERITIATGGFVRLDGMTLDLRSTIYSGNIAEGDIFYLINNGGSGAVQGTFAGLSEGTEFGFAGKSYRISYTANWTGNYSTSGMSGGNDVAVEVIPEPNTWAMLVGGFGMLLSFQRSRRKRVGTR